MSLDSITEKERKAPKGKFVVCVWDAARPTRSTRFASEPYSVKNFAIAYARLQNKKLEDEVAAMNPRTRVCIGEVEYFVMGDRGIRVY